MTDERGATFTADRVKRYLLPAVERFGFYELSPEFLETYGFRETLGGGPVPIGELPGGEGGATPSEDATAKDASRYGVAAEGTAGGDAISAERLADNMAFVLGVDPAFKYREPYAVFIIRYYGGDPAGVLAERGGRAADAGALMTAAIWFRAALVFAPTHKAALYGYARALTALYTGSDSEEYTGNLKAEAIEKMEILAQEHPGFAKGWYYLGYMYLNLGLYTKARLAWQEYLQRSVVSAEREEIETRLSQLAIPIELERGANAIISGRWEEGIEILERHSDARQAQAWWPLWYYLGIAYQETARPEEAEAALKKALRLAPRNEEIMRELIALYEAAGDEEMVAKYERKIELVRDGG
jgi:tetratricopeptide (TPR) repeat protein